jgi:hypothetical protein
VRKDAILTSARCTAIIVALCIVLTGCATSGATTTSTRPPTTDTTDAAETRTANAVRPAAPAPETLAATGCPDRDYVTRTFCYLRRAGVRNSTIDADCGSLLANDLHDPGHACLNDIQTY